MKVNRYSVTHYHSLSVLVFKRCTISLRAQGVYCPCPQATTSVVHCPVVSVDASSDQCPPESSKAILGEII